nr:unnamed protein product [Digitaria exilis]
MAKMQSSSKEQEVHKVASKFHEQSLLKQGAVDEEDSGDTTSSAGENRYPGWPGTSVFRMLIPSHKVGAIIGHKDGDLPPVALEEDRVIEIWGLPAGVHKALELVASHLRKYLVDRSVIPLFDRHVPMQTSHMDMPLCHYNDHPDGPVHAVSPGYHSVKKKMQVPIFYAEAVIGPSGERIEYIRRASRSSILINDSLEGIMSIEITGSAATDVLTAEQLIKNFMAEAAAASPDHSFNFIPSYLPASRSPISNILTNEKSRVSSLSEQRLQMIH